MSLTLPWKSKLQAAVSAAQTELPLVEDVSAVCTCLAAPSHIFATIYTATKSERVILTGCSGGQVVVTRGSFNTTPLAWPAGSCLLLEQVVDGELPTDAGVADDCGIDAEDVFGNQISSDDGCDLSATFDELNVGKGLEIDRTNPLTPVLQVMATGVTPGSYGGAEVNECGQFVSIPAGWPASSLPVFDPCCDDTGTGGAATAAIDVSFTAAAGNSVATGGNVQTVLQQIDDYLTSFVAPASGVQSVIAGACITVAGTAANPVVSVSPSGITPGVYDGFTVDNCGRITSYSPPAADDVIVQGVAPVSVAFAAGTKTYTVSVQEATVAATGVVRLSDEGNIGGNENLILGTDVITWDFLQLWSNGNGGIAQIEASLPGLLVTYDGLNTYDVTPAPDLVSSDGNPIVTTFDAATGKFVIDSQAAAIAQFGAVRLADPATAIATPTSAAAQDVVNVDFLEQWATARGI